METTKIQQPLEIISSKIINANWGKIEGDITKQEDLLNILSSKANTSDLESLSTKDDLEDGLNNKVDKELGKSLIADTELNRLSKVNNYDDSILSQKVINLEADNNTNKEDISFIKENKVDISDLDGYSEIDHTHDQYLTTIPDNTITYEKYNQKLTRKIPVSNIVDLSDGLIGEITLTQNTTFYFTNLKQGLNYLVIVNCNGFTPSLGNKNMHIFLSGYDSFIDDKTYYPNLTNLNKTIYINLSCINDTIGNEKLYTSFLFEDPYAKKYC